MLRRYLDADRFGPQPIVSDSPMGTEHKRPRIGLALGSGSARGWAHIGVIRALEQAGVRPDIVCGTSIGALVGAAYVAGELDRLESWILKLRIADVLGFMDFSVGSGVVKGDRLIDFFRRGVVDRPIEELAVPFAAVATSLRTGAEVWLRSGSMLDAVRASISLPGIFAPARWEGSLLVDGGLANPVPVSLARRWARTSSSQSTSVRTCWGVASAPRREMKRSPARSRHGCASSATICRRSPPRPGNRRLKRLR